VQIAGEHAAVIEAPLAHRVPGAFPQHAGIHLPLPENLQHPAIHAVVQAGHPHDGVAAFLLRRSHLFHEVIVGAAVDHGATRGEWSCGAA